MGGFRKLGVIAGAGDLPVVLVSHLTAAGQPVYVARIAGMYDPRLDGFEGQSFGLAELDARYRALRAAGVDAVTFAGAVKRPDFKSLKLDFKAALLLPKVLNAAKVGDDALMQVMVEAFEAEGFTVIGPEQVMAHLTAAAGPLGRLAPDAAAMSDIAKAAVVAADLGRHDIGQGCVVCEGLVLAVEAQEGTDAMLARVAALPETIRGTAAARRGVLLKRPKPQQERRIDLPTIGVSTVQGAARAGLAGIAVEAGGALVVDQDAVRQQADALGVFVYGFAP